MDKDKIEGYEFPFQDGQDGIKKIVPLLASSASTLTNRSGLIKVSTIVLGAVAATNGVATNLFDTESVFPVLLYTLIGIAISAITGIEAVFKFEKRASQLTTLAANAEAEGFRKSMQWHDTVALVEDFQKRTANARILYQEQTQFISQLLMSSAELGVNIPVMLSKMRKKQE